MILYHGSNVEVSYPKILEPVRALDFGAGFYTTSDEGQAVRWARLQTRRRGKGVPTVSIYEYDKGAFCKLAIKHFETADAEWLDFVCSHRQDSYDGSEYDIVIGPVANDATMPVINDYIGGTIDEATALLLLQPQKLSDQYAFLTIEALETINFIKAVKYD